METELKKKQWEEHEEKYRALARVLGPFSLVKLLPMSRETIKEMLDSGDQYLNSKGIMTWDRAVLGPEKVTPVCPTCGGKPREREWFSNDWPQNMLKRTAQDKSLPWHRVPTLSLAERGSVLKQVARDYALGLPPFDFPEEESEEGR